MSIWVAAVGSSYMCNKEQTLNVTDTLTLYTFELRVQPFEVNKGEFATGRCLPEMVTLRHYPYVSGTLKPNAANMLETETWTVITIMGFSRIGYMSSLVKQVSI